MRYTRGHARVEEVLKGNTNLAATVVDGCGGRSRGMLRKMTHDQMGVLYFIERGGKLFNQFKAEEVVMARIDKVEVELHVVEGGDNTGDLPETEIEVNVNNRCLYYEGVVLMEESVARRIGWHEGDSTLRIAYDGSCGGTPIDNLFGNDELVIDGERHKVKAAWWDGMCELREKVWLRWER